MSFVYGEEVGYRMVVFFDRNGLVFITLIFCFLVGVCEN